MHRNFYRFRDEYKTLINKEECEHFVFTIFRKYSRVETLNLLSSISKEHNLGDTLESIKNIQQIIFLTSTDFVVIHKRATLLLWQFYFDYFDKLTNQSKQTYERDDILNLYLIANEYLEHTEKPKSNKAQYKQIFHASFLWIRSFFLADDTAASYKNLLEFYQKLKVHKNYQQYNNVFKESTGLYINEYLDLIENLNTGKHSLFKLIKDIIAIDFNDLSQAWQSRIAKPPKPFNDYFSNIYPIIYHDNKYKIVNYSGVILCIVNYIYNKLNEIHIEQNFKSTFSKDIIEPVITSQLKHLAGNLEIKTGSKQYEYADFGIYESGNLILFEIKASVMGLKEKYTANLDWFIKNIDKKYVLNEGVQQQVSRNIDIYQKQEAFQALTQIKESKLSIYNVLLVYEEDLQADFCNQFFKTRYAILKRKNGLDENRFVNNVNCIMTFNELRFLIDSKFSPSERLDLIMRFANSNYQLSFRNFMAQQNWVAVH